MRGAVVQWLRDVVKHLPLNDDELVPESALRVSSEWQAEAAKLFPDVPWSLIQNISITERQRLNSEKWASKLGARSTLRDEIGEGN